MGAGPRLRRAAAQASPQVIATIPTDEPAIQDGEDMMSRVWVSRVRPTGVLRLAGVLLVAAGLLWPTVAAAHPLDQYLQISYVTVAPRSIDVELDLTPGVLVAPRALTTIDTNGDKRISP